MVNKTISYQGNVNVGKSIMRENRSLKSTTKKVERKKEGIVE